jgi:hypothetical protein
MNGLSMLGFILIGGVGGWCAYALILGGTSRPTPRPRPAHRDNTTISDAEVRRIMRDWSQ